MNEERFYNHPPAFAVAKEINHPAVYLCLYLEGTGTELGPALLPCFVEAYSMLSITAAIQMFS